MAGDLAAQGAAAVLGRRRAGGAIILLITRVAGMAMGLVVMVMTAKTLGTQGFGTFGFALSLVQIGMSFSDFGLGSLLIREAAVAPRQLRSLLAWSVGTRFVVGTVVALLLAAFVALTVPAGEDRAATLLIIATLPVSAFWLGLSALQHLGLLRRLSVLMLGQSVAWLAATAMLVVQGAQLLAFALVYLLYSIGYAATVQFAVARAARDSASAPVGRAPFTRLLRSAVPLGLTVVIIALYYRLDSIFVYRFSGAAAAGTYAVAYRFLDQAQALPITLSAVFLPLLSAARAADRPSGAIFTSYLRISLLTSVPSVALVILIAEPLVLGVFGPAYQDSVALLQLLIVSFVPITVGYVLGHIAIVHRQARKQLLAAAIALAVSVSLNVVLIPIYGPRAAAIITVVTELAVVGTLYLTLRTPCGLVLPLGWIGRLAAATTGASLVGVALLSRGWIAGVAFALCFLVAGTLLRLVGRGELLALIPTRRR